MATLNNEQIAFSSAMGYGERFIYHTNYVERTANFVASHFGESFAEEVMNLPPQ